jgi:hypothetical protein
MMTLPCNRPTPSLAAALVVLASLTPCPGAVAQEVPIRSIEDVAPLPTPTGNVEDLANVGGKNTSQWSWETKETVNSAPPKSRLGTSAPADPHSPSRIQKDDRNWQDINRGEPKNSSTTFPLTQF